MYQGIHPAIFPLFRRHSQAVIEPAPRNIKILATSTECKIEAISVKGRPHFLGAQFDNDAAEIENVNTYLGMDKKWLLSFNGKYINPLVIIYDAERIKPKSLNLGKRYSCRAVH